MKNFLKSYKALILGIIVVAGMSFAAARYDIYRLRPSPKPGEIVAEKNGFWAAQDLANWVALQTGYLPEDEGYGRIIFKYDSGSGKYVLDTDEDLYVGYGGGGIGLHTTDTFGVASMRTYAGSITYAYLTIASDSLVYSIPCCQGNDGSWGFQLMKGGSKYVTNTPVTMQYRTLVPSSPF